MSSRLMNEAWSLTLPASRKLVLLALCQIADDDGRCIPSLQRLADRCSMSLAGLRDNIVALIQADIVKSHVDAEQIQAYIINLAKLSPATEGARA